MFTDNSEKENIKKEHQFCVHKTGRRGKKVKHLSIFSLFSENLAELMKCDIFIRDLQLVFPGDFYLKPYGQKEFHLLEENNIVLGFTVQMDIHNFNMFVDILLWS